MRTLASPRARCFAATRDASLARSRPPGVRARLRAASPRSPRPATTAAADATSTPASSAAAEVDPAEVYEIQSGKDDGESIASTRAWLEARASDPACAGVYALYDRDERMQFVGYRRDVRAAVAAHAEVNGADAAKVRVAAFANRATATRANLRAEADRWIREWVDARGGEETEIPRGNLAVGAAEWTLAPEPWEEEAAVVPGAMNAGGGAPSPSPSPSTNADGDVVSPYANEAALTPEDEAPLDPNRELKPLTLENVDAALEEVRPYLRADGGDVEVVGIEDGIVAVRLQGACGSCTSSTATLKGGIERTLVRVFGAEAVREVVNLDGGENGAGALSLSREAVEAHLEKLAGAIHNYGGSVKVLDVEDGVCVLEFSGPLALAQSIASAIKGKFPLVKECKIKQV